MMWRDITHINGGTSIYNMFAEKRWDYSMGNSPTGKPSGFFIFMCVKLIRVEVKNPPHYCYIETFVGPIFLYGLSLRRCHLSDHHSISTNKLGAFRCENSAWNDGWFTFYWRDTVKHSVICPLSCIMVRLVPIFMEDSAQPQECVPSKERAHE